MGILLLLALAGVAVALAASQKPKATAAVPATPLTADQTSQIAAYAQIPPAAVPAFVAAIRSGDPRVAASTAAWFRAQGYTRAADLLTAAAESVTQPPAATTAVPPAPAATAPVAAPPPVVAVPSGVASMPAAPQTPSPATPAPAAGSSGEAAVPPFVPPSILLPTLEHQAPAAAPTGTLAVPVATPVPGAPAATPGTAASPTGQDPPLPQNIRTLLESVLRTAHDPAVIYQAADMLQVAGFPNTAAELRKRAVAIASSQVDPIAIIQDILQHAEQAKPPTSPSVPGGSLPQYPAPGSTPPPVAAPAAASASPATTTATPTQTPGVSVTIPTQITIPPIPGITIPPGTVPQVPAPPAGTRYYVVESGDNPSKIAKKFTGDANRWREMSAINPEANLAAGRIYPGQRLKVPASWPNSAAAGPVISVPIPGASSLPIPGTGVSVPIPGTGTSIPIPGAGTTIPMPGAGTSIPIPGTGVSLPIPGAATTIQIPGTGISVPIPGVGTTVQIPGTGVSVPIPGAAGALNASPSGSSSGGSGYDPNLARSLAPQVLGDVATNGDKYDRNRLSQFQRAAALPADGQYGPRSAGAVEYFASASAPPSLPKYGAGKKAYAPPRGTPPL